MKRSHRPVAAAACLLLVGADEPVTPAPADGSVAPADDAPSPDQAGSVAPAQAEGVAPDQTGSVAPSSTGSVAPEPPAAMASPADARLQRCSELLAQGEWAGALALALPAISEYPERAASFEAVARLATDQLARRGQPAAPTYGPALAVPATSPSPGAAPGTWRAPVWEPRPRPASTDPREGFLFGFDVGLTTGARVEWKAKGRTVDGVGFQASMGTVIASGLYLMPATQVYVDFASRSDWQFETSLGILWYSGSAYPMIGLGAQWDPPKPIQVNLGVDVGLAVMPDISVGFLW